MSDAELRIALPDGRSGAEGAWWPRSRDLHAEIADLVDHFPRGVGRIDRVLYSRPDWDDPTTADGLGVRRVRAARGWVKIGSFPRDDTHVVVLGMASRTRLVLRLVPSGTSDDEGARLLTTAP